MLRNGPSRRRGRLRAALAGLAAWLLVPALAEAQQPLFPNLTAYKRKRVPCECEDPIYGLYRRQYYGYFPTCWRPFPPGWGCPSPMAPNSAAAMEEIRREIERQQAEQQPEQPEMTEPPGGMRQPPPPTDRLPIPLPNQPSPFELPPPGGGGARPTDPGGAPPRSPFEPGATSLGPPPFTTPAGASGAAAEPLAHDHPFAPPRRTLLGGLMENVRGLRRH